MIDSGMGGYGTELSDILQTIEEQTAIDQAALSERFWDMFIVDAFIGNWDRHNGNWGFLYNTTTDEIELAPVYGCGSCLYPQADDKIMEIVLTDDKERDFRVFEIPTSAIMEDKKKIRYFDFISSLKNENCNLALKRITPKIDMVQIKEMVEAAPFISELQKRFYLTMLTERKARILDFSLKALENREHENIAKKQKRIQDKLALPSILSALPQPVTPAISAILINNTIMCFNHPPFFNELWNCRFSFSHIFRYPHAATRNVERVGNLVEDTNPR